MTNFLNTNNHAYFFQSILEGMNVAVYLSKYQDEQPQLGAIEAVDDKTVTLAWYSGSYSGKWKICTTGGGKHKKKWTEVVARESIHFEVTFTKTMTKGVSVCLRICMHNLFSSL